jgi:hypothetical protein
MYLVTDIKYSGGIYEITCSNDYGYLRQCIAYEQVKAVGLEFILDEMEYKFFIELFKD